ncbi:TetR/AcrR family transcriptional regulator [Candidatus Gracilibacteria bacterium]|nr:TetR/AcrR family transcriptional regulator [Candidatus Gracilibacteria bacterium]
MESIFTRSFEHNEELLAAALEEFATYGYEQASINRVLAASGMSKGQFYYHFKSKENLYFALIAVLITRKRAYLARVMRPEDVAQNLFGIFRQQIRYGLLFAREYPLINRFAERFSRERGSVIYAQALERFNFNEDAQLHALIARAAANGELRSDLPLPVMTRMIGYLFTHAADLVDLHDLDQAEQQLDYVIAMMKNGLASR